MRNRSTASLLAFSFFLLALISLGGMDGCQIPLPPINNDFQSADISQDLRYTLGMEDGVEAPTAGEANDTERELVEPDVIRRDGSLLYILNQYRGLTLVDLESEAIIAQVPTQGFPRDLYIAGDRAYVLVAYATDYRVVDDQIHTQINSKLYVVDISVPEEAAILESFPLEGDLVDSRLVGDILYAVGAEYQWIYADPVEVTKQPTSSSWVVSVNIADPANIFIADSLSFANYGNVIHATSSAIYVAATNWGAEESYITCVDISDPAGAIEPGGFVPVKGYIADRFKMDEYLGVLRVASNTGWRDRNVYITTIDVTDITTPVVLGATTIEEAAGETLFATRFDGPRGYVVTYLQVDPLFVLDLSVPEEPKVTGMLEVPGWSTHIEPQGDRLIALGVDDTNGRQVSVSIFDVSDPAAPALADRVSFGEHWAWSSAYNDVKAFTVEDDVIIVPFSGWTREGGFDRLQFIGYTPDTLTLGGAVDVEGSILRSFNYAPYYYGVTTEQLAVIDATDLDAPEVVNTVTLAEYVRDYHELSNAVHVEVVTRYENQSTTVRTLTPAGDVLGRAQLRFSNITQTFPWQRGLVVVGAEWSPEPHYRVAFVDCTDPEALHISLDKIIPVQPWWGYHPWLYDIRGGLPEVAAVDAKSIMPWPWPYYGPEESAFLLDNDRLILRCTAERYHFVRGLERPYQGIVVVNLAENGSWYGIGLGFGNIISVNATGTKVYIGTKKSLAADVQGRSYCAYYLQTLDPVLTTFGTAVNVPGRYLRYDPDTQILLLRDWQYIHATDAVSVAPSWETVQSVHSVRWDGYTDIEELDTMALPAGLNEMVATDNRIFFSTYRYAYAPTYSSVFSVGGIAVADSGRMEALGVIPVAPSWGSLLNGKDNTVFVTVQGALIAEYDFATEPMLRAITPVMSSPLHLRFGSEAAYAPLGYAGLAKL